jgi:very-short-patch-repair endonuclease
VDCRWPECRLTVEIDGYRFHNSRHAWERDREREREAHRRGDAFRRYTYDDVAAARTLEELRTLMESPQLSRAVGRSP